MRLIKYTAIFLLLCCVLLPCSHVNADDTIDALKKGEIFMESGKGFLDKIVEGEGYETQRIEGSSLIDLIGLITFTLISLLGIFFVIKFIYAGFLWMTASGNEEQAGKAKNIIQSAIIGIAIVLAAFILSWYIINKIGAKSINRETTVQAP